MPTGKVLGERLHLFPRSVGCKPRRSFDFTSPKQVPKRLDLFHQQPRVRKTNLVCVFSECALKGKGVCRALRKAQSSTGPAE